MSALPAISTTACKPRARRLSVLATPRRICTSPARVSNEKPSSKTSLKSSSSRRGRACRLSTPSSRAAPASAFRNRPLLIANTNWPSSEGMSKSSGEPSQPRLPLICPAAPSTSLPLPKRCSKAPPSLMSRSKFNAVRRRARAPWACQRPVALSVASGLVSTRRFSRHSLRAPLAASAGLGAWFAAATDNRPSRWPRSSKSSISMSSAGTLVAARSSSPATESATVSASLGGSDKRDKRAWMRPAPERLRGSR